MFYGWLSVNQMELRPRKSGIMKAGFTKTRHRNSTTPWYIEVVSLTVSMKISEPDFQKFKPLKNENVFSQCVHEDPCILISFEEMESTMVRTQISWVTNKTAFNPNG